LRVECSDGCTVCILSGKGGYPFLHLERSLIGEGEGKHGIVRELLCFHEVRELVRNDLRLAAAAQASTNRGLSK